MQAPSYRFRIASQGSNVREARCRPFDVVRKEHFALFVFDAIDAVAVLNDACSSISFTGKKVYTVFTVNRIEYLNQLLVEVDLGLIK